MFFITILATAYAITATLRQSQLKSQLAVKEKYEEDINNVNEIAAKLASNSDSSTLTTILELQEKIDNLTTQLTLAQENINTLTTGLTTANNDLSIAKSDISTLNTGLTNVQNSINNIHNTFVINTTTTCDELRNAFAAGKYVYANFDKFPPSYGNGIMFAMSGSRLHILMADDDTQKLCLWTVIGTGSTLVVDAIAVIELD